MGEVIRIRWIRAEDESERADINESEHAVAGIICVLWYLGLF